MRMSTNAITITTAQLRTGVLKVGTKSEVQKM